MIKVMDLLLPQDLPSAIAVSGWMAAAGMAELIRYKTRDGKVQTHIAHLTAATNDLAALPQMRERRVVEEGQSEDLIHDAYFRVSRVSGNAPGIVMRMLLCARLTLLREVSEAATSLSDSRLQQMDRGLADCIVCLAGGCPDRAYYVSEWDRAGTGVDGMKRWIRGHHVFTALTQGLILSFQSLAEAIGKDKFKEAEKWADLAIGLLHASGASLALTGDFRGTTYEQVVRPSMMPPSSAINLSGLMSIDHRFLVQVLHGQAPLLERLREHDPERHAAMAAALVEVYDSHIHVCSRFVGTKPSLLTEGRTSRSGPSLLMHLKTLRLRPFEQDPTGERHAAMATSATIRGSS